ncbi:MULTISPECIES: FUSC family protein [unclassified Methylobacterium]|uniref:FUSC family protein n=1 Tax=unclassified Methylobacterium TaxID=2615210 RepID=UPI0006FFBF81|nr:MULTISPECIES: FUSC family protein [unclassified Methylobacterium]KQP33020.1 fusaric acid resistance protein [Methylobacterium sp. Leaf100]KQP68725.1 fusaric acid resistance protein [Methylobacterium sp. Leaf112]
MSEATQDAPSLLDRTLAFADRVVPPPSAWAFALRIWLAMVLALYAAFWLQLSGASSAMVCVAILAQPKRGQALSKALYRFVGTIVGAVVAIVLIALFAQDRVLLLVSFATWLMLCVFTAHFLQDTRAYGAMLSGYTVAIIAIAHIDAPQAVFEAAVDRVAAIAIGIVAITFINDALASPSTWRTLRTPLDGALEATRAFARDTFTAGDPGSERAGALIRRIAVMRGDASAIAGELDDGPNRAAGARSAIAALYAMAASARAFGTAADRAPGPAVAEARVLCLDLTRDGARDAALRAAERLRDGLADTVGRGADLGEVLALQRAVDFARNAAFAQDGAEALDTGKRPLRDVPLPTHRDFPVALRGAARVGIAFGTTALLLIFAGWPATSFALVQVAATCALSSITPDPKAFARGVLIGMPLAALCAGLVLFGLLAGVQGFPLLAIAIAPVVFVACFLSLNPPTFGVGFILLVFFPVLLSPSNPQTYDPQTFFANALLVVMAALILFVTVRVVLPISPSQHRAFALDSARRALVDALAGEGGDATTRTSLNSDRLLQFAQWSSKSGAVRTASLDRAFDLARMEAAAARAHAELRRLASDPALADAAGAARQAIMAVDRRAIEAAAHALLAAGRGTARTTRLAIARAASDLATIANVAVTQGRFLRRLGLKGA